MKMASCVKALLIGFALMAPGVASAVINPEHYQNESPEALVLLVLESRSTYSGAIETVYCRARVIEVVHSEAGLSAGDEIEIIYLRDHDRLAEIEIWFAEAEAVGLVGEPPNHAPPPPVTGQKMRSFLAPKAGAAGRVFEPAAAHHSFAPF